MIGIILAAGIGSRLRPMTNDKPKCLVKTAGKEILQYQIDAYVEAGIKQLIIIAGYEKESIYKFCRHIKNIKITIIDNDVYELSNNMYSFYLARELLKGQSFILNNGDVAIQTHFLKAFINDPRENLIAVDYQQFNDEAMKVSVGETGLLMDISKQISAESAVGVSLDFYKFSAASGEKFVREIERIIEREGNHKDWTEVALQRMFQSQQLAFEGFDASDFAWFEIDNYQDLAAADLLFSDYAKWKESISHYYFDLDGTIYLNGTLIEGAIEKLRELKQRGKKLYFLTNNSSRGKTQLMHHLRRLGVEISDESELLMSTDGAISYLHQQQVRKVFVLGTQSLQNELVSLGFDVTSNDPEYVLVGYDNELSYEKISTACQIIFSGVDYLVTHEDKFCPTPQGPIPDAGAIISMIETTTGIGPKKVFGKPNQEMLSYHLEKNNISPNTCLVIGDRLHTDVLLANRCGIRSALVLTGETNRDQVDDSPYKADLIVDTVKEL